MDPKLTELIKEMGLSVEEFKAKYDGRVTAMQMQLDAIETAVARGQFRGGGSSRGSGSLSAVAGEHKEKFLAWVRRGGGEDALRGLEVQAGMSTLSDPDGGYMVPEEMDKDLERLAIDSVAMRRLARIVTPTGDYKRPISAGGATGGWVGEKEERVETDTPELKLFSPPWAELYALPEVTQALLDMTDFDVAAWLLEELQDVETEMEGAAFITGDGVKKPHGILAYDTIANASWEYGKVGFVTSGHATLLSNVDKLKSLKRALKPVYRRNATWLMNDTTAEVISNFKDGNGRYIWQDGITEDASDTLFGKPVEIDDNMPDIGADTYPIAIGDWKRAYTIGDHKVGRRLIRDPYTKKGFVKFYLVKRVFGGISNYQALRLMKIAAA